MNRKRLAVVSLALVVIVILTMLNISQFLKVRQIKGNKSYYQREIAYRDKYIEDLKQAKLIGIDLGFVDDNYMGIVFNLGRYTAYDAKVILNVEEWSYTISVGDIDGQRFVELDEYIPIPETDSEYHRMIWVNFEWYDAPQ